MKKILVSGLVVLFFIACQNTSTEQVVEETPVSSESSIEEDTTPTDEIEEIVSDDEEENLTDIEEEPEAMTEKAPTTTTTDEKTNSTPTTSTKKKKQKETVKPTPTKVTTTTTTSISTKKPVVKTTPTPKKETTKPAKPAKPALSHTLWNDLLKKHVSSSGKVNYSGFLKEKAKLKEYTDILAVNPPQSSWSRNKTMAYWINAYNAFTVQLIVDNYPISSIMKLDGGNTWQVKRIKIGGKSYSLNQIEKDLLLKKYKEPRIHFAVNCAAKSCPALLNQAWTPTNLEANFEKMTKKFVNNTQFNEIGKKSLKLSQIFEWYASDFGDVRAFINKYSSVEVSSKAKISYIPYNWDLNK